MKHNNQLFILLILAGFILPLKLSAQYYSTGQNPSSVRWKQINTEGFRVVFPAGYEKTAGYIANTLEYARALDTITLRAKPKKVPVLLHNFTSVSNGMVVWAPRRMELYNIPSQDSYAQEWFQHLAIHEYRHVVQISKLNQGLTRILSYLFGEQLTGSVLGLYVPFWFMEGDAVAAETALSRAGRGRSPSFAMPLRAQLLSRGNYSYDKAVLGSYRDFVPNHYILGYHLVAKSRERYGIELWNHVLDKVGRYPFMVVPFSDGIKDITRQTKTRFYHSILSEVEAEWQKQHKNIVVYPAESIKVPETNIYTSYTSPQVSATGTIIAEKKAMDDIARFVELDRNGNETILHTPGFYLSGTLTVAENRLAWAEREPDPRWEHRNYSVIKLLDLKTGKTRQLTHKTRYFAPALSPDGSKLCAVEVSEDQMYSLVILNTQTGNVENRITTPENFFFTWPKWSDNSRTIVTILMGDNGKAVATADPESGKVNLLTDFFFTDISKPVMHGEKIVFTGAFSGIDNLYLLDIETREISMISSAEYGLTDPAFTPDGDSVVFASYTPNGFLPASLSVHGEINLPLTRVEDKSVKYYKTLAKQEGQILEPEKIPDTIYEIRKYPKLLHLFNLHSWAPASLDALNFDIKPGISLFSQNLLSSAITTMGWEYDLNEQTGKYYLNFSYAGWYPVIDLKMDYGRRKATTFTEDHQKIDLSWMETSFTAGFHVPLNLTRGKYLSFIKPAVEFNYLQRDADPEIGFSFEKSNFKSVSYKLNASGYLKMSSHDILPKWGQILALSYRSDPFGEGEPDAMLSLESRTLLPGMFKHHSLNFYAGYQKRYHENSYYANIVRFPRGYNNRYADRLISGAVNYTFPLAYPDVSLSSLLYIKRFRINLFFDRAKGMLDQTETEYQSTGFELSADTHVLRFLAPVTFSYRLSYLTREEKFSSEFLFSISFDSF